MQSKTTAGFPAKQNGVLARQAPPPDTKYHTFVTIQAPIRGEDVDWAVAPVI